MANEYDVLMDENAETVDTFDFDEFEQKLNTELEAELEESSLLFENTDEANEPEVKDNLNTLIMNVVWEQFLTQVSVVAGQDFIKENRGLTLDLRKEAHIQTEENFDKGIIATHNTEINYSERYDSWQSNFKKDGNGQPIKHTTRTGEMEKTLVKGARKDFDKGRPMGSKINHTDIDHTISAGKIIRDPAANAHLTRAEQIAFANSEHNLNEMDASLNRSKGDKMISEWLDTPNSKGQKPEEIFNISEKEKRRLRKKEKEAKKEYEKRLKEGEKRSVEAGKKSRREEAFRVGKTAIRAVLMQLLAELMKEIIQKLISWLKTTKRTVKMLLDKLKEAIHSFVNNLKKHLINASDTLLTTIATAIWGPIVGTIKKLYIIVKQAWGSLKHAFNYMKSPENKDKPLDTVMMEVSKIITVGITAIVSMQLGDTISKSLMAIPIFAIQIPLLGSLASILGMFFGAIVAGIVGALAINMIDERIAKIKEREKNGYKSKSVSEIIESVNQVKNSAETKVAQITEATVNNLRESRTTASHIVTEKVGNIKSNVSSSMEFLNSKKTEMLNNLEHYKEKKRHPKEDNKQSKLFGKGKDFSTAVKNSFGGLIRKDGKNKE